MRIATIVGGFVTDIVDLDMTIDANGLSARGPASYTVTHPDGEVETVAYETAITAPSNGVLVVAPDYVLVGFSYDGVFHLPAEPQLSQDELLAYAASKRLEVETGGIKVGDVDVATDRKTQAMVIQAATIAMINPKFAMHWQTPSGDFILMDADALKAMATALGDHIARVAGCEARATAGIKAGTIATRDQVDAVFN